MINFEIEYVQPGDVHRPLLFDDYVVYIETNHILPVLLHAAETWTLTETSSRKIEALETWLYRRILKIPWTDRVSNLRVLRKLRKEK